MLKAGVDVTWESVGQYLDALGKKRGINVGTLIGHSGIRRYVMGEAAVRARGDAGGNGGDAAPGPRGDV